MTLIFIQEDSSLTTCGQVQACAAAAVATLATDHTMTIDTETPGSTEVPGIFNENTGITRSAVMFEGAPALTDWGAGTAIVRLEISTANMAVDLDAVYLCERDSECGAIGTYGSATGLAIPLGSTGVQSVNVTCSARTAGLDSLLYVVIQLRATGGMNQTIGITPSQNIDVPINLPLAPGEFLRRYQQMPVPNPLVRM